MSRFVHYTHVQVIYSEEPLCRYYHNHLREVIKMNSRSSKTEAHDMPPPGLNYARMDNYGGCSVDVGGVSIAFMRYAWPSRLYTFLMLCIGHSGCQVRH